VTEYLRFAATLTAVLDPFLAVPIFLALTASHSPRDRVVLPAPARSAPPSSPRRRALASHTCR
jgi:hypothetical protein